jgi:hypothetical protein
MNTRIFAGLLALSSVAAVAFQVGRASTEAGEKGEATRVLQTAEVPTQVSAAPEPARPKFSAETVATAPFHDTYRLLTSASPELIRAYADQIQRIAIRPQRRAAIAEFFRVLLQIDAAEAKNLILQLNQEDRWTALHAIKDAAPPRAMQQVAEIMLTYEPGELSGCSYNYVRDAFEQWSATDPLAVKRFIEGHPEAQLEDYHSVLVRQWAAYDPESAQLLVADVVAKASSAVPTEETPEPLAEAEHIVTAWVGGLLEHDRAGALDYVLTSGHDLVAKAIPSVVAALFKESPEEARAFVLRLPESQRAAALSELGYVADGRVYHDGDDAVRAPEHVAEWMLEFAAELWTESLSPVLTQWRVKNSAALFDWMSKLPADVQMRVAASYQVYVTNEDADEDVRTFMNIGSVALRNQLLEKLMHSAKYAREPVLAALARAELPPEQKTHLATLIPEETPVAAEGSDEE